MNLFYIKRCLELLEYLFGQNKRCKVTIGWGLKMRRYKFSIWSYNQDSLFIVSKQNGFIVHIMSQALPFLLPVATVMRAVAAVVVIRVTVVIAVIGSPAVARVPHRYHFRLRFPVHWRKCRWHHSPNPPSLGYQSRFQVRTGCRSIFGGRYTAFPHTHTQIPNIVQLLFF